MHFYANPPFSLRVADIVVIVRAIQSSNYFCVFIEFGELACSGLEGRRRNAGFSLFHFYALLIWQSERTNGSTCGVWNSPFRLAAPWYYNVKHIEGLSRISIPRDVRRAMQMTRVHSHAVAHRVISDSAFTINSMRISCQLRDHFEYCDSYLLHASMADKQTRETRLNISQIEIKCNQFDYS